MGCVTVVDISTLSFPSGLVLNPEWNGAGNGLETVVVDSVQEGGVADGCGVCGGDEVMSVNGRGVRELGWEGVEAALTGKAYIRSS